MPHLRSAPKYWFYRAALPRRTGLLAAVAVLSVAVLSGSAALAEAPGAATERHDATVRIAVFNIYQLSTAKLTAADGDGNGKDLQVLAATQVIQKIRPDILL